MATQAEIIREASLRDYFPSDDYIILAAPIVEAARRQIDALRALKGSQLDDALRALDKAIPREKT